MPPLSPGKQTARRKTAVTSLRSIHREGINYEPLLRAVDRVNEISFLVQSFIRGFFLHCHQNDLEIPPFTTVVYLSAIKTVCRKPTTGRPVSSVSRLKFTPLMQEYYDQVFRPKVGCEPLDKSLLDFSLAYLAERLAVSQQQNITTNFIIRIYQFCNQFRKRLIDELGYTPTESHRINRTLKKDLIDGTLTSPPQFHCWVKHWRRRIFGSRTKFGAEQISADLAAEPHLFLRPMLILAAELERNQWKSFQPISLRSESANRYVTFDTASIIYLMVDGKWMGHRKSDLIRSISLFREALWNYFFKLKFKGYRDYRFDCQISTDGRGVSLSLIHRDDHLKNESRKQKRGAIRHQQKQLSPEQRIERDQQKSDAKRKQQLKQNQLAREKRQKWAQMTPLERKAKKVAALKTTDYPYLEHVIRTVDGAAELTTRLKNGKVVVIDPGRKAIMTMLSSDQKRHVYLNSERARKSKQDKIARLRENWKKKTSIGDQSVQELESELTEHSSKSVDSEKFLAYLVKKIELREKLMKTSYNDYFTNQRWRSKVNRQRHDNRVQNQLRKKFGDGVTYVLGDYSATNSRIKVRSSPVLGLRKLLKDIPSGLNEPNRVYLLDEFRTSMYDRATNAKMRNAVFKQHSDECLRSCSCIPERKFGMICHCDGCPVKECSCHGRKLHSVLTFPKESSNTEMIDRDEHATNNMMYIVRELDRIGCRPDLFDRSCDPKVLQKFFS